MSGATVSRRRTGRRSRPGRRVRRSSRRAARPPAADRLAHADAGRVVGGLVARVGRLVALLRRRPPRCRSRRLAPGRASPHLHRRPRRLGPAAGARTSASSAASMSGCGAMSTGSAGIGAAQRREIVVGLSKAMPGPLPAGALCANADRRRPRRQQRRRAQRVRWMTRHRPRPCPSCPRPRRPVGRSGTGRSGAWFPVPNGLVKRRFFEALLPLGCRAARRSCRNRAEPLAGGARAYGCGEAGQRCSGGGAVASALRTLSSEQAGLAALQPPRCRPARRRRSPPRSTLIRAGQRPRHRHRRRQEAMSASRSRRRSPRPARRPSSSMPPKRAVAISGHGRHGRRDPGAVLVGGETARNCAPSSSSPAASAIRSSP